MRPDGASEDARRAYWIEQMEAAYAFMDEMKAYPVDECGESLAPLRRAADDAGVEVAFASTKVAEVYDRLFYLREGLIGGFLGLAREMNDRGWILKIEDAYRTSAIQRGLGRNPTVFDAILSKVRWELGGQTPCPDHLFRRLTALVATCPKIGTHMSGSAIDVSVLDRDVGSEIDRGGPYVELSELTPMGSPFIPLGARANRDEITAIMKRHGFAAYPYEFWHYSSGDVYQQRLDGSGEPGRYGAVELDLETGAVSAIPNPLGSLHSLAEIRAETGRALAEPQSG